nr:reverse transcriptase domain-containing protein [Tanacetum cinerariifolium]
MNAGELPEMDPYEKVAQQGQAHPLSPAYVPDPVELDEHVPVYVPEPEHPEYHAPSNDDIQVEDDDEDPEEDPSEEHEPEDDDEDPNEEHKPKDGDTKKSSKGSDETEPFEEDKIAVTPLPPRHRGARISVKPQTPMAASTQALIDAFTYGSSLFPLLPTSPAYDQAQLGRRAAMIRRRDDILEEDMPPRRRFALTGPLPGCDVAESSAAAARAPRSRYNFVDTVEAGQGLIRSPGHDTRTIARAADRAEDIGYVRALQTSEHRMMTSIEEVNLRVNYQAQVRRLEINVVRGQRTAHETELQEVHQAYLSSKAKNRALLARLETLEIHISRIEWQRQSAEDLAVTQMMCIHTLEDRARADMVEDADSSCVILTWWNGHVRTLGHDAAYAMTWGTLKKKLMDKYCPKGEIKKLEIELWNLRVKGNDVAAYTQRFQELALMCTKFLTDETEKVDKYISGLLDNIHGNVMSKLRTYAERQNESKRKANDSPRNNQQPHKNALIDITPTTLENHYDVELADGKIIGFSTIIRGCTLNFMNHPFNIDLMPVPLGSFDVIIGMDWLTKYHGVIICDEKIVRVPFGREMLIFQGNGDNQREESRLNIILCTKAQEYLSKGCDVFLANVTTKEANDKSEGKRLDDVPIVRDFPEVFPEDLPDIPPA